MVPRKHALVAASAAVVGAAVELVRTFASPAPLAPLTTGVQAVLTIAVVGTLGVAGLGLALRRPFGWIAGVVGVIVSAAYGLLLLADAHRVGALWVVVGAVMLYALGKSIPAFRAVPAPA